MSKSAHRGDGGASRPAPAPSAALRTVRDEASPDATVTIADETPSLELNHDTSLLALFEAILGAQAGRIRDHSAEALVVDGQIRALRDELGLPEPAPAPVEGRAASTTTASVDEVAADVVSPPHDSRRPSWRTLVTGLATRRKQYVGMAALAASAGSLW